MDPKQLRDILREELAPIIATQEEHTNILKEHSKILKEHSRTLGEHSEILKEHSEILKEHSKTLGEHSEILKEHSGTLKEHSGKLDSISAELYQVHQLADSTLDLVKGRYDKNKREIDEIKDHLKLPKQPYFGAD